MKNSNTGKPTFTTNRKSIWSDLTKSQFEELTQFFSTTKRRRPYVVRLKRLIKVQILLYKSSELDLKQLVSRTSEIQLWLSKTGFDKKKWLKCLKEIQESWKWKQQANYSSFPDFLSFVLQWLYFKWTCAIHIWFANLLIRWKRLIKTIFRPMWRISSFFFSTTKRRRP